MAKYLVLLLLVLVLIAVPIMSGALAQDLSKCTLIGCNPDPTCPGWCDTSSWCGWRFWENQMKRDAICFTIVMVKL